MKKRGSAGRSGTRWAPSSTNRAVGLRNIDQRLGCDIVPRRIRTSGKPRCARHRGRDEREATWDISVSASFRERGSGTR
jgi:hypothetical protein